MSVDPNQPVEHENHERWLVSYADFITLLFAFFVVMYATSESNLEKQKRFQESLSQSLKLGHAGSQPSGVSGSMNTKTTIPSTGNAPIGIGLPHQQTITDAEIEDIVDRFIKSPQVNSTFKKSIKVRHDSEGAITISVPFQFVAEKDHRALAALSWLLKKIDYPVTLSIANWSADLNTYFKELIKLKNWLEQAGSIKESAISLAFYPTDHNSIDSPAIKISIKK